MAYKTRDSPAGTGGHWLRVGLGWLDNLLHAVAQERTDSGDAELPARLPDEQEASTLIISVAARLRTGRRGRLCSPRASEPEVRSFLSGYVV